MLPGPVRAVSPADRAKTLDDGADKAKSGDAAYRISCSAKVAKDPCFPVCAELWSAAQMKEMEKRREAMRKTPSGSQKTVR